MKAALLAYIVGRESPVPHPNAKGVLMKKTLFLLLILPLLLFGCAPQKSPLAFFEKDFRLMATFSLSSLTLRGECAITQTGESKITLLEPESLCGVTLYKEGDGVRFTLNGSSVSTKSTLLFDFFEPNGARITERKKDGENVFLVAENEKGRYEITLSPDGAPRRIVTEGGTLTVEELLP